MKVYWSKCGHGHGNFGDKITPLLLKRAGVPVEWAAPEHADLIGVGSILEKAPQNFRGTIWTTGFMHESSQRDFSRARVLAVRGHLTREHIGGARITVGDAGLLCDELAPASVAKKHKLGIIPHFVDAADPLVRALANSSTDIVVIDICAEENDVLRSIAACEHIISSSLHGLIVADSLGIPNRWLELNRGAEQVTGAGFKYRDYYSVFGLDAQPLHLQPSATLNDILRAITPYSRAGISQLKQQLRATVASIRDSVRPLTAAEITAKQEAQAEWQQRAERVRGLVNELVPADAVLVMADEDQMRHLIRPCRPFLERNGQYWGPPGSATEAIDELNRQIDSGAAWLLITWLMFWVLKQYPSFQGYLQTNHRLVSATNDAQLFALCPRQ
jgi:pyruvyltransferase